MENQTFLYLRFGQYEHINALYTKGLIYCNTVHHFAAMEDDGKVRSDKDETCVGMKFLGEGIITIKLRDKPDAEPIRLETNNAHYKEHQRDHIGNMYCLATLAITEAEAQSVPLYDIKCNSFGTHLLLVQNSAEFMNRIVAKLNELNLLYEIKSVIYQDLSKHTGPKDPFIKDITYEYQKERRILIKTEFKEPLIFEIGSIEDISTVFALPTDKPIEIDYKSLESPNL